MRCVLWFGRILQMQAQTGTVFKYAFQSKAILMKASFKIALFASCLFLIFGRTAAAKSTQVDYNALAGKSVNTAFFTSLMGWHAVDSTSAYGPTQIVVQTGMKNAYLLTLYSECRDLDFSVQIALTSSGHRLSAGFDKILIPNRQSCRIKTIQPIDVKAMRAAEKAARLANKRT